MPPPLPAAVQALPEIGFHNMLAVRIGFLAAVVAVLLFLFPVPFPLVRLLVPFLVAGFLAVFVYTRRTGQMLSIRSGARMGWITGVFSFVLVGILFVVAMVAISAQGGIVKFFKSQLPANDARTDTIAQVLNDPAALAAGLIFSMLMLFVLLTALPMIGGALGAKVLEKE